MAKAKSKQAARAVDAKANRKPVAESAEPRMDVWDRIAWTCLHLLVIIVPIAMSNLGPFNPNGVPLTYDQFDIVKVFFERGLLLVAVAAWLVGVLLRGGRVRFTKGEWLLLAFLAWVVLTTFTSVHPPTAIFGKYRRFEGLISFVTYGAAFFMALQMADRPSRVRSLARSIAIGGFLVAVYGALQVVGTIGLSTARIVQPVTVVLTVLAPLALGYLALVRGGEDREVRLAYGVGAAIALVGGIIMSVGLAHNIETAMTKGVEIVTLDPVQWGSLPFEANRAFSTFGNPDLLGGYLIFPWAIALALALSEKHETWRTIYWVFALFNVFVGITSYVRGAWIGATVSLILLVIAYRRSTKGTDTRLTHTDWTFIGGTGMLAVAVIVASSLRPDAVRNVLTRVISIFEFGEGSAGTRFQIWEAARAAVAERPIVGWGADTFRLLFPMFKPAEYVELAGYRSVADNVHNYPLQLATGIGIPGAVLFYGSIFVALALAAKTAFAKGSAGRNLILAGFWAAVAGYVVHLMFGLSVTGSTIFMWLSMGVLLGPSAHSRQVGAPSFGLVLVPIVTVALLAGSFLNTRYIVADTHYLKGRVLTQGTERVVEIKRAIELNPYNDMYRVELGSAYQDLFRSSARQFVSSASATGSGDPALLQETLDYYQRATDAFEDMIDYVPQEYDTYVFLAGLHNEAASMIDPSFAERAVDAAKRAIDVEEYGPAARVQLGIAYTMQGNFEDAIEQVEVATTLDPNYLSAFVMLADLQKRTGDIEGARATLEDILSRYEGYAEAQNALRALEASAADDAVQ